MKNSQQVDNILPETLPKTENNGILQFSPIRVNRAYLEKWNERAEDFVVLTRNGELVNNSLYRIGGMGKPKPESDRYFMVLKYVESHYDTEGLKKIGSNGKPEHLEGRWCIIDKNGIEKVVFNHFKTPYLIDNSCIYNLDNKYYNIETGQLYGTSYSRMESEEFLFIDDKYNNEPGKVGVMKINKLDGSFGVFK